MQTLPPEIVKKLKDIKELANPERGGKPGEIENAMMVMTRLLRKYNLSTIDVDSLERTSTITDEVLPQDSIERWKKELSFVLAKYNGCQVLVYDNPDPARISADGFFVVAGQPQNIAVFKELYNWLSNELPKMAFDAWIEAKKQPYPELESETMSFSQYLDHSRRTWEEQENVEMAWEDPGEWRRSYISGVIWGWGEKLERERRTASTQDGNVNALVVIQDAEVLEYINKKFDIETVNLRSKNYARTAYYAGKEVGGKLSTEKQVYGNEESLALQEGM